MTLNKRSIQKENNMNYIKIIIAVTIFIPCVIMGSEEAFDEATIKKLATLMADSEAKTSSKQEHILGFRIGSTLEDVSTIITKDLNHKLIRDRKYPFKKNGSSAE